MNIKKLFVIFVALGLVAISCDNNEPTRIELNRTVIELDISVPTTSTFLLEATVTPSTSRTIQWASSNESVATVIAGLVVAVNPGTAEITATIDGQTATAFVVVSRSEEASITLNSTVIELNMNTGNTSFLLEAIVTPPAASAVQWASSNESVATVIAGLVVAVGPGTAEITVTAAGKTATATVTVTRVVNIAINRTINHFDLDLPTLPSLQLTATVTPQIPGEIEWTTDNPAVVTVDATGLVRATGVAGRAEVTATIGGYSNVAVFVANRRQQGEWTLVWSDEFDGTELNMDNWAFQLGTGSQYGLRGWGNYELQYYTNRTENVRVENGNLVIEVRRENFGGMRYTSGRITTRGLHDFTYGRIEARISLPGGSGTWPAFWTMGHGSWPQAGEIDIMEHVGRRPDEIMHAVHTRNRNGMGIPAGNWHHTVRGLNVVNEFNVYAIEWEKNYFQGRDAIHFYINDVRSTTIFEESLDRNPDSWPFFTPNYLILNVAFGGTLGGTSYVDDSIFDDPNNPVVMKVDWVRVWQRQ